MDDWRGRTEEEPAEPVQVCEVCLEYGPMCLSAVNGKTWLCANCKAAERKETV